MKASVVICTYARPEVAKRLLLKLKEQKFDDFEVLIVVQGDKKDLQEIEEIKDSIQNFYPLRIYYEASPNLPHSRNIGIEQATGEIIIFLDDDAEPNDTLIRAHIGNYTDLAVGAVGGRILGERYEENVPDSKLGTVRKFDGFVHLGFHKNTRRNVMHVKGVNMSVRKGIALEMGGFDERFKGTAEFEELDFCLRLLKKGYKIIFDPAAVVEHFAFFPGGCRVKTREESIYWLYRNHSLMFLNNLNKLFYPILIAEYSAFIIWRSLRWCSYRVILSAFRGICDGWKAHFSKSYQA